MRKPDCFPPHWGHEEITAHALAEILENQHTILENQENQMSKLTDLQADVAKLGTDVDAFIAANSGGASDADLAALSASIQAIDAKIAPPTPPPAPAV